MDRLAGPVRDDRSSNGNRTHVATVTEVRARAKILAVSAWLFLRRPQQTPRFWQSCPSNRATLTA
jgi:hypothetical protein